MRNLTQVVEATFLDDFVQINLRRLRRKDIQNACIWERIRWRYIRAHVCAGVGQVQSLHLSSQPGRMEIIVFLLRAIVWVFRLVVNGVLNDHGLQCQNKNHRNIEADVGMKSDKYD